MCGMRMVRWNVMGPLPCWHLEFYTNVQAFHKPHIRKISDMLLTKTEYIERKDLYICRLLLSELLLPIIRKNTKLFVSIDQRKRSQIIFCFWIRKFFDWIRQKSKLRNLQSWRCGSTKLLLVSNPNSLPMNTGCRRVTVCTVLI